MNNDNIEVNEDEYDISERLRTAMLVSHALAVPSIPESIVRVKDAMGIELTDADMAALANPEDQEF